MNNSSMQSNTTAGVVLRRPVRSQVTKYITNRQGISRLQFHRIMNELRDERPERKIVESEGVDERIVRKIRSLAIERSERQLAAARVLLGNFLEGVREVGQELDDALLEELNEGRAA